MLLKIGKMFDTAVGDFIKVAIIKDRGDVLVIKPLHPNYYDPNQMYSFRNRSIGSAWWSVGSKYVELTDETMEIDSHRIEF